MSAVLDRFLRYVRFDTQSSERSTSSPSTEKQLFLARYLADELTALGASGVFLSEHGCVYAHLPATVSDRPALGFISHLDTSPAISGKNVSPRIVANYPGGPITLSESVAITPENTPELSELIGQDLIVTDGTTLLGADDKAGIAEIMSMAEHLLSHPELPHGKICIAFTPDEEIGRGTDHFDLRRFGADFAYTVDGGRLGELNYENFNAAEATVTIQGFSTHPGDAKGRMKNACKLALEFTALMPPYETPESTDGYEGFYHLDSMEGSVERAKLHYLLRDHDRVRLEVRKAFLPRLADHMCQKYGPGTVSVEITDSYANMREEILKHPALVEFAMAAMTALDIAPRLEPIRGGTDGAKLSFLGLPCPNLSTGGLNFHSCLELIPVPSLERMVEVLLGIVSRFSE